MRGGGGVLAPQPPPSACGAARPPAPAAPAAAADDVDVPGCLVRMYDSAAANDGVFKLNGVFEFVGQWVCSATLTRRCSQSSVHSPLARRPRPAAASPRRPPPPHRPHACGAGGGAHARMCAVACGADPTCGAADGAGCGGGGLLQRARFAGRRANAAARPGRGRRRAGRRARGVEPTAERRAAAPAVVAQAGCLFPVSEQPPLLEKIRGKICRLGFTPFFGIASVPA